MKRCPRCQLSLPLDIFGNDKNMKDGKATYCKPCFKLFKKEYLSSDRAKVTGLRYRQTETYKAYRKKWDKSPAGQAKIRRYQKSEKGKLAKARHKQSKKCQETTQAYYKTDAYRESQKRYRKSLKGKENTRQWNKTDTGRAVSVRRTARYRARVRKLIASLTSAQWKEILERYHHACAYCGASERLQQDHYFPVLKGGHYTAENIVPACRSCNARKHARHPHKLF